MKENLQTQDKEICLTPLLQLLLGFGMTLSGSMETVEKKNMFYSVGSLLAVSKTDLKDPIFNIKLTSPC